MSETNGQSRQHTGGDLLVRQGRLYTPEGFIDDGSVVISAGRIVFAGGGRFLADESRGALDRKECSGDRSACY